MSPLLLGLTGALIGLALAFYATGGELRIVTTYAWQCGPYGRLRFILYWLAIVLMVLSGALLMHIATAG